jgi:predicted ferric reductase
VREASHPQFYIPVRGLRWATPLPLGRILLLLAYWAVIVYMMSWNVSKKDVFYWERIGYRNAWVTIAQLPMLYLLAMKVNPIGLLIGSSHERLNWLHRWIARTMLITATVHGFHFWTMWDRANFLDIALEITPLVKYGIGAWAILLWLTVTGMLPLRRLAYELWVAQHVIASVVMLWLMHMHIPAEARYLLWMAVSFLAVDRAARWVLLVWRNIRIKPKTSGCQREKRVGHHVSVKAVGPDTSLVTIKGVHFSWRAGQHVYLWLPRVGLLEGHPYTIASAHKPPTEAAGCYCNSVQLIVRAHGGFSKRLLVFATNHPEKAADLTGFLSGPYGEPPRWEAYETLVLIGASTGASFTVPILESLTRVSASCVRQVEAVLLAKSKDELEYYIHRSREAGRKARERGVHVRIHIAITGEAQSETDAAQIEEPPKIVESESRDLGESTDDIEPVEKETGHGSSCCCCSPMQTNTTEEKVAEDDTSLIVEEALYNGRPDIEALIREPVEKAWGETAVVVCGGKEVVAKTRNTVAALSDERAVHKGTGAQGIFLHVEEYAF